MSTRDKITAVITQFLEEINGKNSTNLRVTLGTDEWVVEDTDEFPVPLIVIDYETGMFDVLDSLRAALPLWGLSLKQGRGSGELG